MNHVFDAVDELIIAIGKLPVPETGDEEEQEVGDFNRWYRSAKTISELDFDYFEREHLGAILGDISPMSDFFEAAWLAIARKELIRCRQVLNEGESWNAYRLYTTLVGIKAENFSTTFRMLCPLVLLSLLSFPDKNPHVMNELKYCYSCWIRGEAVSSDGVEW